MSVSVVDATTLYWYCPRRCEHFPRKPHLQCYEGGSVNFFYQREKQIFWVDISSVHNSVLFRCHPIITEEPLAELLGATITLYFMMHNNHCSFIPFVLEILINQPVWRSPSQAIAWNSKLSAPASCHPSRAWHSFVGYWIHDVKPVDLEQYYAMMLWTLFFYHQTNPCVLYLSIILNMMVLADSIPYFFIQYVRNHD